MAVFAPEVLAWENVYKYGKTIKEERLRWCWIINKEIQLNDAVKACPYSKRSLERWLAEYRQRGEAGLEPKSTRPKTNPKETPIRIKERVIELRKYEFVR